jgi:hypothetical protein
VLTSDTLYGIDIASLHAHDVKFLGGSSSSTLSSFIGVNISATGSATLLPVVTSDPLDLTVNGSFTAFRTLIGQNTFLIQTDVKVDSFYGLDLDLRGGLTVNGDVYGYKFNFNGTSTGTTYGAYIEGADENYIEGNTTFNDNIDLSGANGKFTNTSGSISTIRDHDIDGPIYTALDEDVISSGRYAVTGNGSNNWATGTTFHLNWIRIGNIVQCHFRGVLDSLDTSGSVIPLPHANVSISLTEGHGQAEDATSLASGASFGRIKVVPHVSTSPSPAVKLNWLALGGSTYTEVGLNTGDAGATVRGSFSYIIT